jgi:hypothetical protein
VNNANDDKSPLIDLLTCIVCRVTMKIASSTPESSGSDLVQYRCEQCGRIELVRLIRRSRDEDESEELSSRYLSRKGLQRLIAARP